MNILELCLSSDLGGLELNVFRTSEALSSSHNITAVVNKNSKLDKYYSEHSNINRFYIKRRKNPLPFLNARKLAHIIDKHNIDILHMHWGKDFALAAFAKYFSRNKPALVYTRQMMITRSKDDFYHNFMYGQLDLMLTITKELETLSKQFICRFKKKIKTLYYGVKEPEHFLDENEVHEQRKTIGFSANDFIIGLIGRLEESKGQHLLIDAIDIANRNGQTLKALIVGHEMNPGYRDKLKDQADKLGVLENIHFQDFTNNPQQLMQLCDCVLLASEQETFGLVLPEAMRTGIAVVGSNSGGVPEIIDHEKTGLLFKTGNPHDLYSQLNKLHSDPDFRENLAKAGKEKADKLFNNETHFKKLEQHFIELRSKKH